MTGDLAYSILVAGLWLYCLIKLNNGYKAKDMLEVVHYGILLIMLTIALKP